MDPWVKWITYLSPYFYGMEGMTVAQWHDIEEIDCESEVDECQYETGQDVLDFYHYDVRIILMYCFRAISDSKNCFNCLFSEYCPL